MREPKIKNGKLIKRFASGGLNMMKYIVCRLCFIGLILCPVFAHATESQICRETYDYV